MFDTNGLYLLRNAAAEKISENLGYAQEQVPQNRQDLMVRLQLFEDPFQDVTHRIGKDFFCLNISAGRDEVMLRLNPCNEAASYARMSASLEIMPWGMLTVDLSAPAPLIVYANGMIGQMMDIRAENLAGQKAENMFAVFGFDENVSPMVSAGVLLSHDVSKGQKEKSWYRLHFIPFFHGRRFCTVVFEDITEKKNREVQYSQIQRLEALGQLAGGVAHDFNNILSIIDGYARIAIKASEGLEETQNYLGRIMHAVKRGSALTQQMLTFGRHKVVKDATCDLAAIVHDQEALLMPLMDASISMTIKTDQNIYVDAAADQIGQILLNLCINARDAMPDGGNLMIEARRQDNGKACLSVIDTGMGMSAEVRVRMFDPFFTTKDQGKGTGLGLSMVYAIVKDMKGDINVISQEGDGTSIIVTLPLSQKQILPRAEKQEGQEPVSLSGRTALVAEDEADLLELIAGMLEEIGIKVLKASNGNEALLVQEMYEGDIDILLADVVMPELNGVKLAEMFETERPDTKIMFMSGYPANGQMARVELPDGALLMPKPVSFEKLNDLLSQLMMNGITAGDLAASTGQWRSA